MSYLGCTCLLFEIACFILSNTEF